MLLYRSCTLTAPLATRIYIECVSVEMKLVTGANVVMRIYDFNVKITIYSSLYSITGRWWIDVQISYLGYTEKNCDFSFSGAHSIYINQVPIVVAPSLTRPPPVPSPISFELNQRQQSSPLAGQSALLDASNAGHRLGGQQRKSRC